MYWYKSKLKRNAALICGIVMLAFWLGCKPDIGGQDAKLKYFDIKGYFTKDIARLRKLNPAVVKTVVHNGIAETKKVHIGNWGNELALFIDADINKPAWKNSYLVTAEDSLLVYRAKDPKLKVDEILINRDKQKVKWILIYTKVENYLYKTTQRLTYFPDSVYSIEMVQRVKLIGTNVYKVKGAISNH